MCNLLRSGLQQFSNECRWWMIWPVDLIIVINVIIVDNHWMTMLPDNLQQQQQQSRCNNQPTTATGTFCKLHVVKIIHSVTILKLQSTKHFTGKRFIHRMTMTSFAITLHGQCYVISGHNRIQCTPRKFLLHTLCRKTHYFRACLSFMDEWILRVLTPSCNCNQGALRKHA